MLLLDGFAGIVTLDTETGSVIDVLEIIDPEETSAITTDADGDIYVADVLCGCVRVFSDGAEAGEIGAFNLDAPRSIVVAADGTLYATDSTENGEVFIHAINENGDDVLFFEDLLSDQPLLTIDQLGQLLVLANDTTVYTLDGAGFSPLNDLQTGSFVSTAMTINSENHLVVATEQQGILIFE